MTLPPLRQADQRRLGHFRAFYDVLVGLRDQIRGPQELGVEAVRQRLRDKLEDLGYAQAAPNDADVVDPGYVMVAMADEVLLTDCGRWPGRDAWIDRPLERSIYGTRMAGDRVFAAADRLLVGPRDQSGTAILILVCLLLGFRGRHRTADGVTAEPVLALRNQLYEHVYGKRWSPDQAGLVDTAPVALAGSSVRRLPTLWPWLTAIIVIVIAYVPVSHVLWRWHVRHIAELTEVITTSQPAPAAAREAGR